MYWQLYIACSVEDIIIIIVVLDDKFDNELKSISKPALRDIQSQKCKLVEGKRTTNVKPFFN